MPVVAAVTLIVGGLRHRGRASRSRRRSTSTPADRPRRSGIGVVPDAARSFPGVSRSGATIVGGDVCCGLRSADGGRVLVLSRRCRRWRPPSRTSLLEVRHDIGSSERLRDRRSASSWRSSRRLLVVVEPFLASCGARGFAPFAWYSHRARRWCCSLALAAGVAGCALMQWLRRSFIAGFFVTVPLFISVAAFIWIFGIVDGLTTPLYDRLLGRRGAWAWASLTTAVGDPAGRRGGDQRDRQAAAAARRSASC